MDKEKRSPNKRPQDQTATPSKRRKTASYALPKHIDYQRLASQCPDLSKYLIAQSPTRSTIDFRDPAAVRSLNRALLKAFFGLTVHLPSDSLCPSVPNRLNYVQWIAENITAEFAHSPIWGVDIGTGASCVYPLLGVRVMPQCRFVATDINECSIQAAKQNVESNGLDARIRVYLNKNRETKLPLDDPEFPLPALADGQGAGQEMVAFCMCNPPFYESEEERKRLGDMKAGAPSLQTGGKNDELYTEGGEAGFLKGLLAESKVLRERVRWYTTMVGKKSTLAVLKAELNAMGVARTKEGKLLQGRTTRWVIAWSFVGKTHYVLDIPKGPTGTREWLEQTMQDLGISVKRSGASSEQPPVWHVCSAARNTWSRRARRQAKFGLPENDTQPDEVSAPVLQFKAAIGQAGAATAAAENSTRIDMYLETEADKNLLESLYNHMSRKLPTDPAK